MLNEELDQSGTDNNQTAMWWLCNLLNEELDWWGCNKNFDSAAMTGKLDASIYCAIALWTPVGAEKAMSFMANTLL